MKTILITGGTDGIGKGIALAELKKGNRVIVVGSSLLKGNVYKENAREIGQADNAFFIQADLSLIQENQRVIKEIKDRFSTLNAIVLCAANRNYRENYKETSEGFELTFALCYLSRFILSYGLKRLLEEKEHSVIINVCAPSMDGEIKWNNLEYKEKFDSVKTQRHCSRLNDLLGVQFSENDSVKKVRYILFNPWAVRTESSYQEYKSLLINILLRFIYLMIGKPIEKAIHPILDLLDNPPKEPLTAFLQRKEVNLSKKSFDKGNARRLFSTTIQMLENKDINICEN